MCNSCTINTHAWFVLQKMVRNYFCPCANFVRRLVGFLRTFRLILAASPAMRDQSTLEGLLRLCFASQKWRASTLPNGKASSSGATPKFLGWRVTHFGSWRRFYENIAPEDAIWRQPLAHEVERCRLPITITGALSDLPGALIICAATKIWFAC